MNLDGKKVIISRTDSIGDVMLTLPICVWLKEKFPTVEIIFLGKGYTRPIVNAYSKVDKYIDWNYYLNAPKADRVHSFRKLEADAIIHVFPDKEIASLAKKIRIPVRVGTSHRAYHLLTCSHRVNFTRKNSTLHESQLNYELLRPFGLTQLPELSSIIESTKFFGIPSAALPDDFASLKEVTILHPKSQGSAKEWPIEKYLELAKKIADRGEKVAFTGTEKEGEQFRSLIPLHKNIIDTTGKFTLEELMVFISTAKNLVACSTGPLHLAGYYGVNTIGLYSPKRPIHPGRWKALGKKVNILAFDEACESCSKGNDCNCILEISVEKVLEVMV